MREKSDVGARLADYLNRRDMTLTQAAEITGVHFTTLGNIVAGRHNPHRRTAYKIEQLVNGHIREARRIMRGKTK